ncbi:MULTISPECIES: DUF5711 family protein [unclassified Ruminococcus]|uniref:DUF5711 family protein n=1 Tax=unclassified Ruminococcus TaxID=2608920 RepID=UPI00210C6168|nr:MULTISPECIES: DUF5711 family protein [unclassified Ruminococcus]MCQ4022137.1 hypothetical protein [Ruminococcus sp. zg-924]MCQ4114457.1 hypothetical protein [Ruminococcus sp. zg-921]
MAKDKSEKEIKQENKQEKKQEKKNRYKKDEKKEKKKRLKTENKHVEKKTVPMEYTFSHTVEETRVDAPVSKDVISAKTKTAVLILLGCLLSVIIATGWNYIAPDKLINSIRKGLSANYGEDFPTPISGTKISSGNFQYENGYLTYVSDTSLICLNKTAGKVVDRPISFLQPALEISGDQLLTYNINGNGFQVDSVGETKTRNELENPIIQGDIAGNGVYGFITTAEGYLSKLTVFDSSNKQKFAYYFSEYYATSMTINQSGTQAAVATVSSSDGDFKSVIYVLDFTKEEPIATIDVGKTLIYRCEFMDNGSIAAIGDNQALMIQSNYTDIDKYNYDGLTLTSYAFDRTQGGVIALSPSTDGGNCHLVYLNKNGTLEKITDTQYRILDLDLYGGKLAALCDGGFTAFYTTRGEEAGIAESGLDAQGITMYGENSIYVLGISEIREVSAG